MRTYREKLLFKILVVIFLLVAFCCELYMSVNVVGPGSVSYKEASAIKYEEDSSKDIIKLKYNYINEFNTKVKYDNTYKVVGVLSSYSDNIKIFEHTYNYVSNTSIGEDNSIILSLDNIEINYQELMNKLKENDLSQGELTVYYYLSINAISNKLNNGIVLENKDNITIKLTSDGYTIDDKNSSTNNNMTINDSTSKVEFQGIHFIYSIIIIGVFIVMLVRLIKFIKHHIKVTNSFNNRIKRITKGYEDRIINGKEMKYPKKCKVIDVDNFEELIKVSKKAKDYISQFYLDDDTVIFAVRLEDNIYQYKLEKED